MPLKIAFLGWDARLTARYLRMLQLDNEGQVKTPAGSQPRLDKVVLRDGTEIINVYSIGLKFLEGWRFDQVILADDRRMEIKERHRRVIAELLHRCGCSNVPEEFRLQIYDIDEEAPT